MIGKLKGTVDEIGIDFVIIDVGGVGYLVHCSANTLRLIPSCGEVVSLVIETHVREDHIHLYGFFEDNERQWFRVLTTVSGVGTKVAIAILSGLTPEQLTTAFMSQDKSSFTQISGIGSKLAIRLLTELKDKYKQIAGYSQTSTLKTTTSSSGANIIDAVSALSNLGYGQSEAYTAVTKVAEKHPNIKVEDLIRISLKEI